MFPHGILYLMSSIGFVISCEDTDVYIYEAPSSFTDIPVHAKIVNQENGFNYSEQRSEHSGSIMLTSKQLSVVGCGAVFTSPEIRIQSPQFPNSYPRDTLCLYVINAVSPNVCLIEVNFLNFDLGSCGNGDSLVVAGQSLCGFLNGIQTFRFSPPGSLIQFRTGSRTGGRGFDLFIRQKLCPSLSTPNLQCSGVFSNPSFVLQSPGYPGQYPNNVRCQYILRPVLTSAQISLCIAEFNFEQFSIPSSQGCIGDRLQIGDQDVLCGSVGGIRTYQFLGELRVNFFASSFGNSGNFRIVVRQLGCSPLNLPPGGILPPQPPPIFPPTTSPVPPTTYPPFPPTIYPPQPPLPPVYPPIPPIDPSVPSYLPRCCGKIYQNQYALLASPGFPFNSENENIDCVYEIRPYNQNMCRLKIVFKLFWVGEDNNYSGCWNGFLEVDGRRYCGCKTGTTIRSEFGNQWSGRQKYLRYKREANSRNSGGFLLEIFQERCSGWLPWGRVDHDNKPNSDISYLGQTIYHTDLSSVSYSDTQLSNQPIQRTNCKNDISNDFETSYSYISHSESDPRIEEENFSQSEVQINDSNLRSSAEINNRTNCKSESHKGNESFSSRLIPTYSSSKKSQTESNSENTPDFRKIVIGMDRLPTDKNFSKSENETTYNINTSSSIKQSETGKESIDMEINKKANFISSNKTKINISFAENDRNINTTNNYFSIHSVNSQLTDSQNKNLTKLEKAAGERLSMIKPNNGDINALINSHSQSTMNADVVLDTNSLHNHSKMNLNGQLIFDGNNTKDTIQCELLSEENRIRNNCSSLVITTTTREKRNAFSPEVPAMYYYPSPNSGSDRLWFLGESSCRIWGFAQWLLQAKQYFWNSVPDLFCPVASQPRCQIFNQVLGWIQSSGYPQAYPSNSNTCYRFQRLQGYCQIQLTIADFSLEYSNNCAKDYFLIGKRRYCGEQLASTYPVLDISTTSQVDLTFVSDGYYSGRGFRIHYQYLPCGRYARAISVSSSNCDKVIRDRNFILTQNEADGEDFCTYNILQNSTSHLCNLQLAFSKFDLICGQEFLQIGREQYCGNLSGQSVDVQFLNSEIPVRLIYHKLGENARAKFTIRGQQTPYCNNESNIGQSSQCVIQLSDIQGFVSYPGFELASTESGVCSYVIKPQEGMCSVKLKFSNFFIPSQQGKCTRFLDVGGTKFCSDELKDKDIEMNFNGLELEIPISIEGKTKISAWNFTYTQLPCGETRL